PASNPSRNTSTPMPSGETTPMPVTTTRRSVIRPPSRLLSPVASGEHVRDVVREHAHRQKLGGDVGDRSSWCDGRERGERELLGELCDSGLGNRAVLDVVGIAEQSLGEELVRLELDVEGFLDVVDDL